MKNAIKGEASMVVDAPREVVFDALTNPGQIKKYFFGTEAVSDWKVGSPLYFRGEWEGKKYEDKGTILEKKDGELLKYKSWVRPGLRSRRKIFLRKRCAFTAKRTGRGCLVI